MEKSFDEVTVSTLSDLQLGGNLASSAGVTIPEHHHREAPSLQLINNSGSINSGGSGGQQQRNSSVNGGNAVENNLNRTKKSSNKSTNPLQQQQQPVFNPHSKHLDVWLANAIRGLETATSQDSSDQLDSPTPKGGSYGEPLSLPPNLNYLDAPNSSSPFSTGLFSPTQLLLQQPPPIGGVSAGGSIELGGVGGGSGSIGGVTQQNPYRFGIGGGVSSHQYLLNDSSEFASLPPRINHQQLYQHQQQQQQLSSVGGRRHPLQRNQSSSFQDLLNAQRIMTDSYINDSSDNESKNGCAKSKLEMAESLLADLNLLNNGSGTSTASGNGTGGGGGANGSAGGFNGNSTTSGANLNSVNNNSNGNNNLVVVLLKEIGKLHETNKKICRNLHETKVEMEALKHSSHWGLSHRRDSISGLSTNSQPVGMRYNSFGLQSPAPTYHSQGSYSPGLVADVIREIREVSRVREEAMMDRMKTMIEERSWALNETNFRLLKETEDAKKSIHHVRAEMNQMVDRMLKLENEVINLRAQLNNQQLQQQLHLRERDGYGQPQSSSAASAAKLRRNSMHLNYGRINNTDEFYGGNNFNDLSNELRFGNGNGGNGSSLRGTKIGENSFVGGQTLNGAGGGSSYGDDMHEDSASDQVLLLEKDALKLRRELQDALASKQESENRITALENIVSTLKEQVPPVGTSGCTIPSLMGAKSSTTTTTTAMNATSALSSPAGMVPASGGHHLNHHHQQQQHQYYFRSINNGSPNSQQQQTLAAAPVGSVSPSKLQKAAQIQSIPTPAGKQFMHLAPGPVTDL
ncbi:dual specificity protein kinase splB isoform X3 [Armigeres subalbatus]|uniref:dual specificity protein kinase splB isoform X3 n=1 Tax=Armigeres subalbatus TaxID=124917 RepID=UPI002ED62B3E